jgi:hypothetical protein
MKNASTRTLAVCLSGKRCVRLMLGGKEIVFSTILCLLGSIVKGDGPATLSTIIRISCKNDNVAESPTYTT